jgi:hypothetical protein
MQKIMNLFPVSGLFIVAAALIILMGGTQQVQGSEVFAQSTNDSTRAMDIQNQSVSYFGNASGYLVSPVVDNTNIETGQFLPLAFLKRSL